MWLVAPAAIATFAAAIALWAFDRIRTDLRSGQVIRVTGIAVVTAAPDAEDSFFRVRLQGRRLRVPSGVEGVLRAPCQVTAYYPPWSGVLVNLGAAHNSMERVDLPPAGGPAQGFPDLSAPAL